MRGYTFIGWTLNELLSQGEEQVENLWIGFGTRNLRYHRVRVQAP